MKITLRNQKTRAIYPGLGWDVFQDITRIEKIIDIGEAGYMKENAMPTEPKTIQDWEKEIFTVKIREEHGSL